MQSKQKLKHSTNKNKKQTGLIKTERQTQVSIWTLLTYVVCLHLSNIGHTAENSTHSRLKCEEAGRNI